MKRTCILLGGPVRHDARVIKVTDTISHVDPDSQVDLFYLADQSAADEPAFAANVTLHALRVPSEKRAKILRHSLFTREFDFFVPAIRDVAARNGAPYDVIYANDLPMLRPAVALKRAMKSRLIYDSHEIYLETLNQFLPTSARFPKQLVFNLLLQLMRRTGERAERRLVREADVFLTVNQSLAEYFREKYRVKLPRVVMNCPPLQEEAPQAMIDFRAHYGWQSEETILIYQGVLNKGRGLELLMPALLQTDKKIKLVIVGDGTLREPLLKLIGKLELTERVKHFGQVPQQELLRYTVAADIGINLLEDFNLSKKMASPNKLFEYMHAGLPVLASNSRENQRVFEKYEIGFLTENRVDDIAANINQIVNSNRIAEFQQDSLRGAREYCWQKQKQTLAKIYEL